MTHPGMVIRVYSVPLFQDETLYQNKRAALYKGSSFIIFSSVFLHLHLHMLKPSFSLHR